jgi:hypothetical protein
MNKHRKEEPNYGNWVSLKLIYIPGVMGLCFLGLSILLPLLIIGAAIFFLPSVYFVVRSSSPRH